MSVFNGAILGLGLFFLGLQLTGQNMRALAGGGFRAAVSRATASPMASGICGLFAGALMQSATAVTFIVVSMLGSGVVQTPAARLIVVWCNPGLTALAFLAAFNIHPFVAFWVGMSGIAMGSIRKKPWNTVAGALLGVGVILFALEQLGSGLAPLKEATWFRDGMELALSSPWQGFAIGIAAAAILQSNTGATMVLITLVESGALGVTQAVPAVYGTNLGAILLRILLARGLKGSSLRLVRMEDLFCLFSGAVMMLLLVVEDAGVPLVRALAFHLVSSDPIRLALVFFLSNAVPAILMTPCLPACGLLLKRLWPNDPAAEPGHPQFLTSQALADPESALDLVNRELGRLFSLIEATPRASGSADEESNESPSQVQLGAAIEQFCVRLASEATLTHSQSLRLQQLRAWLHTLRHIGEAAGELSASLATLPPEALPSADPLLNWVRSAIAAGAAATSTLARDEIRAFHQCSKLKSPEVNSLRTDFEAASAKLAGEARLRPGEVLDNFDILAWLLHRLSKLLLKNSTLP